MSSSADERENSGLDVRNVKPFSFIIMSTSNVWPVHRSPYHGDLVQGHLGNCFLIASLQSIASCQVDLLKSLVRLSPLSCSFYRQGQRVTVPVDLQPLTDDYPYCRSTQGDVQWPYIVEQAYAQFYGGRLENLQGGNTSEAFYDLLGRPVEEFEPTDRGLWEKLERGLTEKTVLATCGSVKPGAENQNQREGLRVNHAYAILATFVYRGTREKYLLIHNPHGINHLPAENPRIRQAFFATIEKLHPLWSKTLGTQLISWSELQRTCNRIQLCHLNVESRQILSGHWSMGAGGCSNFGTFFRNPFVLLPSTFSRPLFVVLGHSIDQRQERTDESIKLDYPQLGVTLIRLKSSVSNIGTQDNYEVIAQSKFWNKREVCFSGDTGPRHALVFSTFYPNVVLPFWIQIFSRETLPRLELRTTTSVFHQTLEDDWQRNTFLLRLSTSATVRFIVHQVFETFVALDQHYPIGIRVVSESTTNEEETRFIRARSISKVVQLNGEEEYFVVPTSFQGNALGRFALDVLADVSFTIERTEREAPKTAKTSEPTTKKKPLSLSKIFDEYLQ